MPITFSGELTVFFQRGTKETSHLEWRIRIFGLGGGLGIGGVWLDNTWMVNGALVVLLAGVGLRFARDKGSDQVDSAEPSDESSPPDDIDDDPVSR